MGARQPDLGWFGLAVGTTVLMIFAAYAIREIAGGQQIPLAIHGLMGVVVGSIYGRELIKKK